MNVSKKGTDLQHRRERAIIGQVMGKSADEVEVREVHGLGERLAVEVVLGNGDKWQIKPGPGFHLQVFGPDQKERLVESHNNANGAEAEDMCASIDPLEAKILIAAGGFTIEADSSHHGRFFWRHSDSATESESLPTREFAARQCVSMIVAHTMAVNRISTGKWRAMTLEEKKSMIREEYVCEVAPTVTAPTP